MISEIKKKNEIHRMSFSMASNQEDFKTPMADILPKQLGMITSFLGLMCRYENTFSKKYQFYNKFMGSD